MKPFLFFFSNVRWSLASGFKIITSKATNSNVQKHSSPKITEMLQWTIIYGVLVTD